MKKRAIELRKGYAILIGEGIICTVSQKRLPIFETGFVYIHVEELLYPLVILEKTEVEVVKA